MNPNRNRRRTSFINLEDLRYFCQEKGFSQEDFFSILDSVIKRVLEERVDRECETEVVIGEDKTVRVFNLKKTVVEDEKFSELDDIGQQISFISLSNARAQHGEDVKVGDQVRDEIFLRSMPWLGEHFSESISADIQRLHRQRLRETYEQLVGETLRVTLVARTRDGYLLKNVESLVDAKIFLSNLEVARGKEPVLNEIFEVSVKFIEVSSQGAIRVIVSTVSDQLLREALYREVPELRDGLIKIVTTSRSLKHNRAKVAVARVGESGIDPVGCFIGANGVRMRAILQSLKGERINVFEWREDKLANIAAAMSPARVVAVIPPKRRQERYTVIVPDIHHPLAIGAQGSNVALASSITNCSIDIMQLSEARRRELTFTWNGNITEKEIENLKNSPHREDDGESRRHRRRSSEGGGNRERERRHRRSPRGDGRFDRHHEHHGSDNMDFGGVDMRLIDAELKQMRYSFDDNYLDDEHDMREDENNDYPRDKGRVIASGSDDIIWPANNGDNERDYAINADVLLGLETDEQEDFYDNIKEEEWV